MGLTGSVSRGFLYGFNNIEVYGLERFIQSLDRRRDPNSREKGLLTGICPKLLEYVDVILTDSVD